MGLGLQPGRQQTGSRAPGLAQLRADVCGRGRPGFGGSQLCLGGGHILTAGVAHSRRLGRPSAWLHVGCPAIWGLPLPRTTGGSAPGQRGWQASALPSEGRCVKDKSQALKGDVPGKFKIPKKAGKECCPGHLLTSPDCSARPEAMMLPSRTGSASWCARSGWGVLRTAARGFCSARAGHRDVVRWRDRTLCPQVGIRPRGVLWYPWPEPSGAWLSARPTWEPPALALAAGSSVSV